MNHGKKLSALAGGVSVALLMMLFPHNLGVKGHTVTADYAPIRLQNFDVKPGDVVYHIAIRVSNSGDTASWIDTINCPFECTFASKITPLKR
jgi:hypothetical protein